MVLVPVGGTPISTVTREVREEKKVHPDYDRFSSEDNDSKQSTLIKIKVPFTNNLLHGSSS